jgi:hypothetical protein
MTLEELKNIYKPVTKVLARPPEDSELAALPDDIAAILAEDGEEVSEEEESTTYDTDDALEEAYVLLEEAMAVLGYYSDRGLTSAITPEDRRAMAETSERIYHFLDDVGELDEDFRNFNRRQS